MLVYLRTLHLFGEGHCAFIPYHMAVPVSFPIVMNILYYNIKLFMEFFYYISDSYQFGLRLHKKFHQSK